ncbi:ABC transporter permease [Streptomyces rapamycinicus]|uniref:ABC transporter permease n=3 Tax=Streptomyces rapamycinicus TaxID=1226757 RepID=A0A0A0NWX4_STRRN|nr:FtsX-like permease family protein [Streptomyces rapamycinicus]AGP60535.1 ABC transporter permease [Streptomyces rapamycinicus NRRL 5491]MBB4788300.1 putative ABC transport system permease protein [Streptomyces rapamycinicus]RLV72635.1 ABC transporter permease [Streptomyces rapamycinicus NRRL 5491]UTP36095.1 FtsX-like permease family protein [Streptomyces rapamycinicus NRRL 5491]
MFRTALRTLRSHRLRFAMPALAVVLGVAFVTGSLLYGDSVRAAVNRARSNSQPDASVSITADPAAPHRLDDTLLRRLRALPSAAAARGVVEGRSFLVGSDGTLVGDLNQAAGVNYVPDGSGKDIRYPLAGGRGPRGAAEIAVDRRTAERAGYRVGARVRIVVAGTALDARLVGVFTAHDSRVDSGGTLTAFDTATAQRHFAPAPKGYSAITLTAAEGTSDAQLAQRAQTSLPSGLRAVTRAELESGAAPAGDADKLTTLLLSFAGIALFVSTFLVANTFTMLSAARAREHALLRAIGATTNYVMRMVLTEAAVVGTAASAIGYGLGVGVAHLLGGLFDAAGAGNATVPALSAEPLLAAFAVGIGVTVLAAYLPARRAAAVPPVAALRTVQPSTAASLRRRNAIGLITTACGALLIAAAVGEPDLLFGAAPLLLVGLIVLTPLLALGLTGLLRSPLTRLAGVRGKLAVENARRNPRRTAATATTLMVGLAMVTAVTVAVTSVNRFDEREADRSMASDLRITAVDFGEVGQGTAARVARLADAEAVTSVIPTYFDLAGKTPLSVTAVDPAAVERAASLTVREGSLDRLDRGIAVTEELAAAHGWRLGSRVTGSFTSASGRTPDTRASLPVVAIYDGPEELTPALVSERALPRPAGAEGRPSIGSVLVKAAPGRTAALQEEIRRALDNPALLVQDRADARAAATARTAPFLNIMYAMLSVTVLIGALGVVNTMSMAVFERVREIGLLRAIGLDRGGIGSVLRLESVTISLFGSALGVVAGTAIGAAAVLGQEAVPLVIPWDRTALFFLASAAIGVLASLWPGRQAARIPMLEAIGADTE